MFYELNFLYYVEGVYGLCVSGGYLLVSLVFYFFGGVQDVFDLC